MPTYLLDTDIASYIMKRSNDLVLKQLSRISVHDVCISAITLSELSFGVAVSPKRHLNDAALQLFLKHIQALDYPQAAAEHYGEIRAYLKSKGMPIGPNDLLIAAHARSMGMVLVSNNTREFMRIPKLLLENWAS